MNICLGNRTADTVKIYFEKAKRPEIKAVLPQKAQTVEEALEDYRETLLANAKSYGKIIIADGNYIGDIWCYGIDVNEEPNAMLSFCIFEKEYWSRGIATEAVALFLQEIKTKYEFNTIGAFSFADNFASIRVLEKNGFTVLEEFTEE
ncbi:MAG: GNAT family N-acetyltransferase, partial [Lachnospiraceae bacterium]|nr:GNAT family N-acetyltransferase [Lachnospiraceae bacterium]